MSARNGILPESKGEVLLAKINGVNVQVREFCRLRAKNGWEGVIATYSSLVPGAFSRGPVILDPSTTEAWGFNFNRIDSSTGERKDWDLCYAAADAIVDLIEERNQLEQALRALVLEIQSSGYVGRAEAVVLKADEVLGEFKQ